jgi:hypothetical protein
MIVRAQRAFLFDSGREISRVNNGEGFIDLKSFVFNAISWIAECRQSGWQSVDGRLIRSGLIKMMFGDSCLLHFPAALRRRPMNEARPACLMGWEKGK